MSEQFNADDVKLDAELKLSDDFSPPSFEEWKKKVEVDLKGASFEKKLLTKTYEGITLNPIYTRKEVENSPFINSLPSYDNFVRGDSYSGYHKKAWSVNQEISIADTEEFNEALINALNNGQNCINISLDTATKDGIDADYSTSDKVGDKGLSISGIQSLTRVFKNIDLTKHEVRIHAGAVSISFLSLFNAYLKSQKINPADLKGSITADPLFELVQQGNLNLKRNFIFDSLKAAIDWAEENNVALKLIGVNTTPYVNSGANSIQEMAISLSTFVYYANQLIDKGVSPKTIFNRTEFTFGISTNYFMEISKFRAVKVLLSNIAEAYGVDEKDLNLNITAKSSEFYFTKLDPYVNMLRSTTQAFSAIVGGVDGLTVSPFDEVIRKSDTFSRRISRNTQTILREESHLDQVIDPAGGSYFIETLTEELANRAWKYFQEIEDNGGIVESLKQNKIQNEIDAVIAARNKDINKRKAVIVGTNMFADIKEKQLQIDNFDKEAFFKKRSEYLKQYRVTGSNEKHKEILTKLQSISDSFSKETINIMIDAYLQGATLGEIFSSLTSTQKGKVEITPLKIRRASEGFEELRNSALSYKDKTGELPKVYLANWGSIKDYKARADFSKGFFEVGGFEVIDPKGSTSVQEIVSDTIASETSVVTICSTDNNYETVVPELAKELKNKKSDIQIILAGFPKEKIEEYKNAGVDDFIFLGADAMEKLTNLLNKIGGIK